jgi:hypothetical protein
MYCRMIPLAPPLKCQRRKHLPTHGTSALAMKSDKETHIARLSLEECFVNVDVFFILGTVICILVYLRDYTLFSLLWFEIEFLLFMV